MAQIKGIIIAYNTLDNPSPGSDEEPSEASFEGTENSGTIILDATCASQNISYPQDVNLLNEARENLKSLIDRIYYDYSYYKPRMYCKNARRDYLNLAKCKKHTTKKKCKAIRQPGNQWFVRFMNNSSTYMRTTHIPSRTAS